MGKLQQALDWAARGFRIFPLEVDGKLPIELGWTETATSNPEIIRSLWTDPVLHIERDNNIGVLTDDFVVLDVDVKNGKSGLETFAKLGLEFDTLTNRTPSGGFHLVYSANGDPVGNHGLGPDLDVRGYHGFIVAPGSTIGDSQYLLELDLPIAPFPEHLRPLLKKPRPKLPNLIAVDFDAPESLELAAYYLQRDAPVSVEGANGDDTAYRVACRVRDLAVSEPSCLELMLERWNDRCEPPWPPEELQRKIENAYRYATGAPGSATPIGAFEAVQVEPPKEINGHDVGEQKVLGRYVFGNLVGLADIAPRPWVMGDFLLSQAVTMLIASGGVGKSSFSLVIAAHLAMGRPFLGMQSFRPGKSIIYNAEDDLVEASRRLHAICQFYQFPINEVKSKVALVSSDAVIIKLLDPTTKGADPTIVDMARVAADPDVTFAAIDPLVEVHDSNENDNVEMKRINGILREAAKSSNTAFMAIHHTGKPPAASSQAWAGSQFAGRGASSLPAGARVAATLFPASDNDVAELGIKPHDKLAYVRLDGAKGNFSRATGQPRWMKWETVYLPNGDAVGVLGPHNVGERKDQAAVMEFVEAIHAELQKEGSATLPVADAEQIMRKLGGATSKETSSAVRFRMAEWFGFSQDGSSTGLKVLTDKVTGAKKVGYG